MPKCLSSIRHLTHCDLSARARKHVLSNKETIVKRKIMLLMRFSCIPTMCVGKKAIIQLKIILWIDYRFRLKSSCSIIPFIFIFFILSVNGICRWLWVFCCSNITVFIKSGKKNTAKGAFNNSKPTTMRDLFLSMKVFIQLSNVENIKRTHSERYICLHCISYSCILRLHSCIP